MTRKRFVKLCMAKGWSMNDASLLASRVSFAKAYERLYSVILFISAVQEAGRMIQKEIGSIAEGLQSALDTAMEGNRL